MKASILLLSTVCLSGCFSADRTPSVQTNQVSVASTSDGKTKSNTSKHKEADDKEAPKQVEQDNTPVSPKLTKFLKGFTQVSFPLVLNDAVTKMFYSQDEGYSSHYIPYGFEKFIPEMRDVPRFSREVSKEFFYVGKVSGNNHYTGIVYAIMNTIAGDGAPWAFTIATYDRNGNIIDHLRAGKAEVKDPYRIVTINADGSVLAKDYKQTWEKDPVENGYYENKLVSSTLVRTAQYHFADDGRIVRDNVVVSMK